ncbi:MAG: N-acetyl-gamma-glutamyl-phosphate reductase [Bacteroidia bacterium]|nr:MAG: N-acetyl-gamma-glutamyl-phosphate reductase [Bacteroidia bacterium]
MPSAVVSILGASGYSGAELLSILARHSSVRIDKLFANASAGKHIHEVIPRLAGVVDASLESYSAEAVCQSDIVFIALPSGEAMNLVPELLKRGKRVIDLGGDFRLTDPGTYERFYKKTHTAGDLLGEAVYGLTEWNREKIQRARLVANPGCYPTSILLPLLPLLKEGLLESKGIVVNSLSGVSGAGRSTSPELSFVEVNESVKAYKIGTHQHIPEIARAVADLAQANVFFTFVPHLLPITRGIYTTISAPLASNIGEPEISEAFRQYYEGEPFIRFVPVPEIKHVAHSNFIDIGYSLHRESGRLIILSAIDNLVKGAAGQAVQNMNLMLGMSETEALL